MASVSLKGALSQESVGVKSFILWPAGMEKSAITLTLSVSFLGRVIRGFTWAHGVKGGALKGPMRAPRADSLSI